jgi:hypothetical protein
MNRNQILDAIDRAYAYPRLGMCYWVKFGAPNRDQFHKFLVKLGGKCKYLCSDGFVYFWPNNKEGYEARLMFLAFMLVAAEEKIEKKQAVIRNLKQWRGIIGSAVMQDINAAIKILKEGQ